jgi:hypothetical protein
MNNVMIPSPQSEPHKLDWGRAAGMALLISTGAVTGYAIVDKGIVPAGTMIGRLKYLSSMQEDEKVNAAANEFRATARSRTIDPATQRSLDTQIGQYCRSQSFKCSGGGDVADDVQRLSLKTQDEIDLAATRHDRKALRQGFQAFTRGLKTTIETAPLPKPLIISHNFAHVPAASLATVLPGKPGAGSFARSYA